MFCLGIFHDQFRHLGLLDEEIGLALQHFAHLQAVLLLVTLGARRPYGRPPGGIEQAKLDSHRVRDFAHDSAQGIHFAHQMALGDPAHGGIARHLRYQVHVQREQGCLQPHAGRGHGSFASSVPGADDDHIVLFSEPQHCLISILQVKGISAAPCRPCRCGRPTLLAYGWVPRIV